MSRFPFVFFTIVIIFCFILLIATFYWGYKESFILFNSFRIPALDRFSLFFTEFGNGFYLIIFALTLACTNPKYWKTALFIIVCVLITAIIVQICKQILFPHWHRPAKLLQDKPIYILLNPVPHHNSFPSGHSISIMSITAVLSFTLRKRIFELFFAILACWVAYTRIYVGAHFPADVAVGSLLGCITSIGILYIFRNLDLSSIQHKKYVRFIVYAITLICYIVAIYQSQIN